MATLTGSTLVVLLTVRLRRTNVGTWWVLQHLDELAITVAQLPS